MYRLFANIVNVTDRRYRHAYSMPIVRRHDIVKTKGISKGEPAECCKARERCSLRHRERLLILYRGWRFWVIFIPLGLASVLVALEGTAVSTALPSINNDLRDGDFYVWFINGYFVSL